MTYYEEGLEALTVDNAPYTVGRALDYLEGHGLEAGKIDLQIASKGQGTRSEICAQKPDPGTLWPEISEVTLTINPGAVVENSLASVLQSIARHLQFDETQEMALDTLRNLLHALHETIAKQPESQWQQAWARWRKNKEEKDEAIPFRAALENGSLMQLQAHLPKEARRLNPFLPELLRLLADAEFAELLKKYFSESNFSEGRSTHVAQHSRFAFLATPETAAAEAKLVEPEEKEKLNGFKRYVAMLYGRLEQFEKLNHAGLLQLYLEQTLAAGTMGVDSKELSACFEKEQLAWLHEDLKNRRHRLFTAEGYLEKLARYLAIKTTDLNCKREGKDGVIRISFAAEIKDKKRRRAEWLRHLLVPVMMPVQYEWGSGYMKLGRRHSNELGKAKLR